jgi:hypothetical protein
MEKTMKAYTISCPDDDHGATVAFGETAREARQRANSDTCDCGYINLRARRSPELDQYAPGPVPILTLMSHGWYALCPNCERQVYEDQDFVADGQNTIYCNQACKDEYEAMLKKWSTRLPSLLPRPD